MPLKSHSSRTEKGPGFFSREELRLENADEPWTEEDFNKALDMHICATSSPKQIGLRFGRSEDSIKRGILALCKNERGLLERYQPKGRTSRRGAPFNQTEQNLIARHAEFGFPTEWTAKLLCREANEIRRDSEGEAKVSRMREVAPLSDLCWAHAYLIHSARRQLISAQAFETMVAEEREFGGAVGLLPAKFSNVVTDYPAHIRSLAYYLLFKDQQKKGKWNADDFPLDWKPK